MYYKDKLVLMKRQIVLPSLFSPVRRAEGKEGRGEEEEEGEEGVEGRKVWGVEVRSALGAA